MVEYQDMVKTLAKSGEAILKNLTPEKAHIWHMVTGIVGEAGELIDAVKKHVVYGQELDINNVIEEKGDIEFYMEGLRQALNITRDETLEANKKKLAKRYENFKYSDEQAKNRADKA